MVVQMGDSGLVAVDSRRHGTGEAMAWRILTYSHGRRNTSRRIRTKAFNLD